MTKKFSAAYLAMKEESVHINPLHKILYPDCEDCKKPLKWHVEEK